MKHRISSHENNLLNYKYNLQLLSILLTRKYHITTNVTTTIHVLLVIILIR